MAVQLSKGLLPYIHKYRTKGIIVDTNLLLLYFVGSYDPNLIEKFDRLRKKAYTKEDFLLLLTFLRHFSTIIITPHILTELSYFLRDGFSEKTFELAFKTILTELQRLEERAIQKGEILTLPQLPKFGVTDTGVSVAAKKHGLLVITDDFKLNGFLNEEGIESINLTYLRFA